jgi:hypothetical protein
MQIRSIKLDLPSTRCNHERVANRVAFQLDACIVFAGIDMQIEFRFAGSVVSAPMPGGDGFA